MITNEKEGEDLDGSFGRKGSIVRNNLMVVFFY